MDASRVNPEIRERLVHQCECFAPLAAYWQQGEAVNPRAALGDAPAEPAVPIRLTGRRGPRQGRVSRQPARSGERLLGVVTSTRGTIHGYPLRKGMNPRGTIGSEPLEALREERDHLLEDAFEVRGPASPIGVPVDNPGFGEDMYHRRLEEIERPMQPYRVRLRQGAL